MDLTFFGRAKLLLRSHMVVVAICLLGAMFYGFSWLMIPQVNPNPTKKIVVSGTFPYEMGWELRIDREFYSKNPICKQTALIFLVIPVAEVSREKVLPVNVSRLEGMQYETSYYEDHFLPGLCDWTAGFAYYRIYSNEKLLHGGAILGFPNRFNKIDYGCSNITMPRTGETGVACYEGNNRSFDPSLSSGKVNFRWAGGVK